MKIKTTAGNWYFPAVLVNKVVYRGQIDAYNVYLDICSAYIDAPAGCDETSSPSTQKRADNSNQHVWLIVFTIVTQGESRDKCNRNQVSKQMRWLVNTLNSMKLKKKTNDQYMFILLLAQVSFCFLKVHNGLNATVYDDHHALPNFGRFHYSRVTAGQIFQPAELQPSNYDLCNSSNYQEIIGWVLVNDGNCSDTTKASNAQNLGASGIVIQQQDYLYVNDTLLRDDGYGFAIYITVLYVDGTVNITNGSQIAFQIDVIKNTKPKVKIGLDLQKRDSQKFLRNFVKYYEQLQEYIDVQVYYQLVESPICRMKQFHECQEDQCIGNGRYCLPDGDLDSQYYIFEYLRQLCIFDHDKEKYLNYLPKFDKECLNPLEFKDCSKKQLDDDTNNFVLQCFRQQFTGNDNTWRQQQSQLLDKQIDFTKYSGLQYYPGVVVNNQTYKGTLKAKNVREFICSAFDLDVLPSLCEKVIFHQENKQLTIWKAVGIIFSVIILCLIVFFFYRRYFKKKLHHQQISQ
ncbi:hypothetical protein pb186bvf_010809 [Paramecium bursaria]